MFMYVLFYLGQLTHFPSCLGAGVTNLNEPLSSFLLPPNWTTSNARWGGYVCRWSSTTEWEMYKTPRVYPPPQWHIVCRVGR